MSPSLSRVGFYDERVVRERDRVSVVAHAHRLPDAAPVGECRSTDMASVVKLCVARYHLPDSFRRGDSMFGRAVFVVGCLGLVAACSSASKPQARGASTSSSVARDTRASLLSAIAAAPKNRWKVTYDSGSGPVKTQVTIANDGGSRVSSRSDTSIFVLDGESEFSCTNVPGGSGPKCSHSTRDAGASRALMHQVLGYAIELNDPFIALANQADTTHAETIALRQAQCFTFRGRKVQDLLPPDQRNEYPSFLDPSRVSMTECFDEHLGILLRATSFYGSNLVVATTVGSPSDSDFAATP